MAGLDPAPVLGGPHERLLHEVLGGVPVAGEQGRGAQQRHPALAHVGVEGLPVGHRHLLRRALVYPVTEEYGCRPSHGWMP